MIQDTNLVKAVSNVYQRSERQSDVQKLVGTFVDVGILPQLNNRNNQILYGRRGTGKTHVLKVLESQLEDLPAGIAVAYTDCRTLGSSAQFEDEELSIHKRCIALFRDILAPIHSVLIEHIIDHPGPDAEKSLEEADRLLSAIVDPVRTFVPVEETRSKSAETEQASSTRIAVSPRKLSGELDGSSVDRSRQDETTKYAVNVQDKLVFPALQSSLERTLDRQKLTLYVLIDEWAAIPKVLQPYLAEFLKKTFLPIGNVIIKIAALEYRALFSIPSDDIGFEIGADISTAPDLDDYYVFDRNPDRVTEVFADILLKHLNADLPDAYLEREYGITTASDLASKLFTQTDTFKELARASEGVVRDMINIFNKAYFDAHKRGRSTIDQKAVLEASRQWFEQDKVQHLTTEMEGVLRAIVDEVIGERNARSFLLPRSLQKHPIIQKLFDARVLHLMQRGYADKDNPGVRYDIYALDYGTYVDLIGTTKQPMIELFDGEADSGDKEIVVPFDDKRSIRRIILREEFLPAMDA